MTKTQIALAAIQNGDTAKCFSILKTFRLGFTKEEKRTLEMASDIAHGLGRIYLQLGYNTCEITEKARMIVKNKYNV